jgi:hypothetical protein
VGVSAPWEKLSFHETMTHEAKRWGRP